MSISEDRVKATDPPDVILLRIEELKAHRELAAEDFDRDYLDSEIRWAERALKRSADVVRGPDGLTYYKNTPA